MLVLRKLPGPRLEDCLYLGPTPKGPQSRFCECSGAISLSGEEGSSHSDLGKFWIQTSRKAVTEHMAHVASEDRATGKFIEKKLITDGYKEIGQEKPGAGASHHWT